MLRLINGVVVVVVVVVVFVVGARRRRGRIAIVGVKADFSALFLACTCVFDFLLVFATLCVAAGLFLVTGVLVLMEIFVTLVEVEDLPGVFVRFCNAPNADDLFFLVE